jgi:hypothetical protein
MSRNRIKNDGIIPESKSEDFPVRFEKRPE